MLSFTANIILKMNETLEIKTYLVSDVYKLFTLIFLCVAYLNIDASIYIKRTLS